MSLKAIVESLDSVSEELKPFYTEMGGVFALDVDGVETHPSVTSLKKAYDAEKERGKSLKADLARVNSEAKELPEDFDLSVWEKAKSGQTDQAQIEAAKLEVRKAMEGEVGEWKSKFDTLQGENRTAMTNTALTSALTAVGVTDSSFLEASRLLVGSEVKYNDEGKPYIDGGLGPMSIEDHVGRWAKDAGKAFITKAKGADTGGNDSTKTTVATGNKAISDKVSGFADLPVR